MSDQVSSNRPYSYPFVKEGIGPLGVPLQLIFRPEQGGLVPLHWVVFDPFRSTKGPYLHYLYGFLSGLRHPFSLLVVTSIDVGG